MSYTNTTRRIRTELRGASALALNPKLSTVVGTGVEHLSFSEHKRAGMPYTKITLSQAFTIVLGAAGARAGGVKLFDFPALGMVPLAGRFKGDFTLTAGTATFSTLEIGLGSVIATGSVAVLGGTTTFEDQGIGTPGTNVTAGNTIGQEVMFGLGAREPIDGRAGAFDLNLNVAGTIAVATSNLTVAAGAIVELFWFGLAPGE